MAESASDRATTAAETDLTINLRAERADAPDIQGVGRSGEMLSRSTSTKVLAELLSDGEQRPGLRAVAAVALGRDAVPASRDALRGALAAGEPQIVRRAAASLGRVGTADDIAELATVETDDARTAKYVEFAQTLISYRLGLGIQLLRPPAQTARLVTSKSEPVEAGPITEHQLRTAIGTSHEPAVRLSGSSAFRISCGEPDKIVALGDELRSQRTLDSLLERNCVIGAVLARSEDQHVLYPHLYLLSHPESDVTIEIFGVRPSGTLVHYGAATIVDGEALFEIRSVVGVTPAVRLQGRYQHLSGRVGFSQAFMTPLPSQSQAGDTLPW